MATYEDAKDELVSCPFNPSHRVKASRFQLHLAKCEKAHRNAHVATCPFNAQHRPCTGELNHHLLNCECRGAVDRQLIASAETTHRGHVGVPSYYSQSIEANENWDNVVQNSASAYTPSVEPPVGGIRTDFSELKPAQRRRYYNSLPIIGVESENSERSETPELREPKTRSQAQMLGQVQLIQELQNIGLGRGQAVVSSKIAANIYGKPPQQQMRQPNTQPRIPQFQAANLGMGRGTNAVNGDIDGDEDFSDGRRRVNTTKRSGQGTRK